MTLAEPAPKNWWERNWKWFVPVGCLGLALLIAAFAGGIALFVFGIIKSTDVAEDALRRAQAHEEVRAALGEPVEDGWYVTGSVKTTGPVGDANLAIPLRGSRGKGTLYLIAEKRAGRWEYELLEVEVEVQGQAERIDLLAD